MAGDTGVKNSSYLVSIEAFSEFFSNKNLRDNIANSIEYKYVRIPVLTSWSFHSRKEEFDFKTVFQNLDTDSLLTDAKGDLPDETDKEVKNLINMGFAPVNHALREGGQTVSWYRGPFIPYEIAAKTVSPDFFADAKLVFQPEMGMFDISYSAAFMLGRLLAMQSGSFYSALNTWKRGNKREALNILDRRQLWEHATGKKAEQNININRQMLEEILLSKLEEITVDFLKREQKHSGEESNA
jgi:hypothetical protein